MENVIKRLSDEDRKWYCEWLLDFFPGLFIDIECLKESYEYCYEKYEEMKERKENFSMEKLDFNTKEYIEKMSKEIERVEENKKAGEEYSLDGLLEKRQGILKWYQKFIELEKMIEGELRTFGRKAQKEKDLEKLNFYLEQYSYMHKLSQQYDFLILHIDTHIGIYILSEQEMELEKVFLERYLRWISEAANIRGTKKHELGKLYIRLIIQYERFLNEDGEGFQDAAWKIRDMEGLQLNVLVHDTCLRMKKLHEWYEKGIEVDDSMRKYIAGDAEEIVVFKINEYVYCIYQDEDYSEERFELEKIENGEKTDKEIFMNEYHGDIKQYAKAMIGLISKELEKYTGFENDKNKM